MPERLAYDEAMLFSATRLKISDPELKQGKVEIVTTRTAVGTVERPWGIEGGFAVVYKFRTRSGQMRALRCFRVPLSQDMQFRYEQIGPYFQAHLREITVGFNYYDAAILVKDQGPSDNKQAYPVISMEWIDGVTLIERVDELCRARDKDGLRQLARQWLPLLASLRRASIAHGDLAGMNVMVRPDGRLVLVDYDGVFIPEFAGMKKVLLGQSDYQHPQMAQRQFNEHMDEFSALVIYTALLALEARLELWEKYEKLDAQGKLLDSNLLFTQRDFQDPRHSALFQELEQISGSQQDRLAVALKALKRACLAPIDQARFPFDLGDAAAMNTLPVVPPVARPNNTPEVVREARDAAPSPSVQQPGIVLQNKSVEAIAATLRAAESPTKGLGNGEQQLAEQAAAFIKACQADDDREIAAAYEAIDNFGYLGSMLFTPRQQQRARLAQQRRSALARLSIALASKRPRQIVAAYDKILDGCKNVTARERELVALSRTLVQAYERDDDTLIVAYDAIQQSPNRSALLFTEQEQQRIQRAQQRKEALITFQIALRSKRPQEIAAAYDAMLDDNAHITGSEREQLALARAFTHAYDADDDSELARVATALQQHPHFELTEPEQQRLALAQRRQHALDGFLHALAAQPASAQQVVDAYNAELLDQHGGITPGQRALVAEAHAYLAMSLAVREGIALASDTQIRAAYDAATTRRFADFSPQEQQRIDKAFLSARLDEALALRAHSNAFKLATEIQEHTGQSLQSLTRFKLQKALIRFIRQHDLTGLTVHIEARADGNYLCVRWHWPAEELVRNALIAWSPDGWPPRLYDHARLNSGGRHAWIEREDHHDEGQCVLAIGHDKHVYVQGYTAMLDHWDPGKRWRFADGLEPTSQGEATLREERR